MIDVGIIGASGYGGGELLRLIASHPGARAAVATSKTFAGQPVAKAFPGFHKSSLTFTEDELSSVMKCDVVLICAADHSAMELAQPLLAAGRKVIDLGASFRFRSAADFEKWYGTTHSAPDTLKSSVYGLPELHAQEIASSSLVGNPGCYTTAAILALAPAVRSGIIEPSGIVIDGKSGVSGAGRSSYGPSYHFSEINESTWAYKIAGRHRHTGEIEQELSGLAGQPALVSFTPHVVPMTRGVLATCYGRLRSSISGPEVIASYREFYSDAAFVEIRDDLPSTKDALGSNMCHIGIGVDSRAGMLTVVAAIDNLGKGMAGQAIQNMNIMFGLPEDEGLRGVSLWP